MKSFLSSIGVALAAAFSASLSAAILSSPFALDDPLCTLLFITALSLYFALRLLRRYEKASIIHNNPPLFLLAFVLSVFIFGYFLIAKTQEQRQNKIHRYNQLISLWKDGMHSEAINRLEDFALLDQLKK